MNEWLWKRPYANEYIEVHNMLYWVIKILFLFEVDSCDCLDYNTMLESATVL